MVLQTKAKSFYCKNSCDFCMDVLNITELMPVTVTEVLVIFTSRKTINYLISLLLILLLIEILGPSL